jgi:hypothetical protein
MEMGESLASRGTFSSRAIATGFAALVLALAVLVALLSSPAEAGNRPGDDDCAVSVKRGGSAPDALAGVCDYLDDREGVFQVALFDAKSGAAYKLSTGDARQVTASIVKVNILARYLRKYDKPGARFPDDIPYSIQYLMQHMIQNSDNVAATSLFFFGGGCDALTSFNERIPMPSTDIGCQTATYYGWGNTTTTAPDQVRLLRMLAYGTPRRVLSAGARDYALSLMQSVEPDQRFGVSCGPWGGKCDKPTYADPDPDVKVALKNGWKTLPECTKPIPQCPWQVNSGGWVNGKGRNYVLSVLTTRNPVGAGDTYGFDYGIDTIQNVSKLVWSNLGPAGKRP